MFGALLFLLLLALVGTHLGLGGRVSGHARAQLSALLAVALACRWAVSTMAGVGVSLRIHCGHLREVSVQGGSAHGYLAVAGKIGGWLARVAGPADAAALAAPVFWRARLDPDGRLTA